MQRFYKYQGAGNDFVLFDNRSNFFDANNQCLIKKLCDRHFGVGADGLMLLQSVEGHDFEMIYFNSDGRRSSMCGNGARCMVAFAYRLGLFQEQTHFLAADGIHTAFLSVENGLVKLKMIDVHALEIFEEGFLVDTGSPHYIVPVANLSDYPVVERGRAIRHSNRFAEHGVNVNFVEPAGKGYAIRTYERGVEDETLACGTGATAAAIAMAVHEKRRGPIQMPIYTRGGELTVYFERDQQGGDFFSEVFLEGPARSVFEGLIDMDLLMSSGSL